MSTCSWLSASGVAKGWSDSVQKSEVHWNPWTASLHRPDFVARRLLLKAVLQISGASTASMCLHLFGLEVAVRKSPPPDFERHASATAKTCASGAGGASLKSKQVASSTNRVSVVKFFSVSQFRTKAAVGIALQLFLAPAFIAGTWERLDSRLSLYTWMDGRPTCVFQPFCPAKGRGSTVCISS